MEWVLKRCNGDDVAQSSPIGLIPKAGTINTDGLKDPVDWQQLFSMPKTFWQEEVANLETYFSEQFGSDLPDAIAEQLNNLKQRVSQM